MTTSMEQARAQRGDAEVSDYYALMKPRVMRLAIFTAFVGLAIAPTSPHPVLAAAALICVAIGAGACGALNMWWDADIDRMMERTESRPIPLGRVTEEETLGFGVGLAVLSVALLSVFANPLAGALLAAVILFYIVVYTMWLKRLTPLNIVIGGAAGAAPPAIGWAIATGGLSVEPILLFMLIFLWTPPHSWALALFRRDDYAAVEVPMLPVAAGEDETRRQIWLYSLAMGVAALAPVATDIAGWLYLAVATPLTLWLLRGAYAVRVRSAEAAAADKYRAEKRFFGATILYLFVLFLALLAEAGLKAL